MKIRCRKEFVEQARKFKDVPFRHRGRTERGLDCAGLIVLSLSSLGYEPFDKKVYGREPFRDGLRETVEANMGPPLKDKELLGEGDIALMRFDGEPHHLAIVGKSEAGYFTLVHSFGNVGKVVEHRLDDFWRSRIVDIYRFEEE